MAGTLPIRKPSWSEAGCRTGRHTPSLAPVGDRIQPAPAHPPDRRIRSRSTAVHVVAHGPVLAAQVECHVWPVPSCRPL